MTPALAEIRDFLANVQFARPALLWLFAAPLALVVFRKFFARRDEARNRAIGRPGAVAALRTHSRGRSFLQRLCVTLGWAALVLAAAGPRWGRDDERGVAVGRDLVFAIDFSRSMWAEDMDDRAHPARWKAALDATRRLVEDLRTRGGHRVAVVLFAARPVVAVPLTTDYDHVAFRLDELDATVPPAEVRPADDDAVSGTRLGAALAAAVAAHDDRFPGFQDIILLTDGDDPANDSEWRLGVRAAREAKIPIHAVGIGDPAVDAFVYLRGQPLEAPDKTGVPVPIQTRLREDVVEAIARESTGAYWSSRRETPDLRELFRTKIESNATRELGDERLPQPRERYHLFLLPAFALLALAWWRER